MTLLHDVIAVKADEQDCVDGADDSEHISAAVRRVLGVLTMPTVDREAYWRSLDKEHERRIREAIAAGRLTRAEVRR